MIKFIYGVRSQISEREEWRKRAEMEEVFVSGKDINSITWQLNLSSSHRWVPRYSRCIQVKLRHTHAKSKLQLMQHWLVYKIIETQLFNDTKYETSRTRITETKRRNTGWTWRKKLRKVFLILEIQAEPNKTVTTPAKERESSGVCSDAMK